MSSKITYMVRPISVYTEFLQTEIFQPNVLATGHCHNRFLCNAKSRPGAKSFLLNDSVWPSL